MGSLWNRSGTIERYGDDIRADGAKAFFFQGGTTSPMTVYADANQSDAFPHPLEADANGRWPDVFIPYVTNYDVRVESKYGETLSFSQRIPNPDPVQQTVIVPPERQVNTGAVCPEFTSGPKSGYVRLNGKTIGNGLTSGPNSERANIDCKDLFRYLWNSTTNDICPVLPVKGTSNADADFDANKTLTLVDMRAAILTGLDDMGNSPAGKFGTLSFTVGNSIIVGSMLGANQVTLTIENIPSHTHTGSTSQHLGHVHQVNSVTSGQRSTANSNIPQAHTHQWGAGIGPGNGGEFTTSGSGDLSHTHPDFAAASGLAVGTGAFGVNPTQGTGNTGTSSITLDHVHTGAVGGTTSNNSTDHLHVITATTTALPGGGAPGEGAHVHTFTTDAKGGDPALANATRAFNNMPVARLVTWYIKL